MLITMETSGNLPPPLSSVTCTQRHNGWKQIGFFFFFVSLEHFSRQQNEHGPHVKKHAKAPEQTPPPAPPLARKGRQGAFLGGWGGEEKQPKKFKTIDKTKQREKK